MVLTRAMKNALEKQRKMKEEEEKLTEQMNRMSVNANYDIDNLASGDETDDDEQPRKQVPKWAEAKELINSTRQQYGKKLDYENLFGSCYADQVRIIDDLKNFKKIFNLSGAFGRLDRSLWAASVKKTAP